MREELAQAGLREPGRLARVTRHARRHRIVVRHCGTSIDRPSDALSTARIGGPQPDTMRAACGAGQVARADNRAEALARADRRGPGVAPGLQSRS
ncbi:MAG: hypothetical protein U1E86_15825 [Burkholderiaceae bacterium]